MANNNNWDPNVMQQLYKMYQEGKININPNNQNVNQGANMNPNMSMNPNMGMGMGMNPNMGMGMNPNMGMSMNPMMFNFPPFIFGNQGNNMNTQNQFQPQANNSGENWTLIFERKYDNKKINVQVNSNDAVMTAFSKYRKKSLENDIPLKFTFKGKPLDAQLSISASGLNNNSEITVEKINVNKAPNININSPPPGFISLIFDVKNEDKLVNIQIEAHKKVKDAIDAYLKKTKTKKEDVIFIFNSKTLNPELTLAQAGLISGCKILAVSLVNLEGA